MMYYAIEIDIHLLKQSSVALSHVIWLLNLTLIEKKANFDKLHSNWSKMNHIIYYLHSQR